jgi:hypothetical protein
MEIFWGKIMYYQTSSVVRIMVLKALRRPKAKWGRSDA